MDRELSCHHGLKKNQTLVHLRKGGSYTVLSLYCAASKGFSTTPLLCSLCPNEMRRTFPLGRFMFSSSHGHRKGMRRERGSSSSSSSHLVGRKQGFGEGGERGKSRR